MEIGFNLGRQIYEESIYNGCLHYTHSHKHSHTLVLINKREEKNKFIYIDIYMNKWENLHIVNI